MPRNTCPFCKIGKNPSYKDYEELTSFMTDRAKILARSRTGLCARHQRILTREIKRARFLALLPFQVQVR